MTYGLMTNTEHTHTNPHELLLLKLPRTEITTRNKYLGRNSDVEYTNHRCEQITTLFFRPLPCFQMFYLGVRLLSSLVPEWKFYFLVHSLLTDSLLQNSPLKLKKTV